MYYLKIALICWALAFVVQMLRLVSPPRDIYYTLKDVFDIITGRVLVYYDTALPAQIEVAERYYNDETDDQAALEEMRQVMREYEAQQHEA